MGNEGASRYWVHIRIYGAIDIYLVIIDNAPWTSVSHLCGTCVNFKLLDEMANAVGPRSPPYRIARTLY